MALKLSSIARNLTAEDEGEWVDIPEWAGVRIKARSIKCKDYLIAHGLLQQRLMKALGRFPTEPEWEPALGKLVATHLLRGWKGIVGDDEITPIEWTAKVGIEHLTNREMSELEKQVIWAATRVGDREAEFTVDVVKNSDAPSAMT